MIFQFSIKFVVVVVVVTPALSSYRLFRRNGLKRFDNGPSKSASCPLGSPKSGVACVKSPPPLKQIREGGAAP